MTSQRKRIFNWFIDTLNQNNQNVEFSGNFIFKFWAEQHGTSDFEIISQSEETLDFESREIVPVVSIQNIEIPFVEQNKRSDFEQEFYVALKVDNRIDEETNQIVIEFDDDDPKYKALIETTNTIRSQLSFPFDGFKFTVKAREPQVVQTFKYNGNYYTIFSIILNMTAIESGFYGNEMEFFLATQGGSLAKLDVIEADIMTGKNTSVFNEITFDGTDQRTHINSRTWQAQLTVNYRGNAVDNLIFNEMIGTNTDLIVQPYNFRMSQGGVNYNYLVFITSVNANFRNNSVQTLTFQLERV
jgi:hypothetical protein